MKDYLDKKIDTWFHERGIIEHGKPMGQAIKTLEETTELIDALNRGDELDIKDAIGGIYVALRGVCLTSDIFLDHIYNRAVVRLHCYDRPFLRLCPVSRQTNTNSGLSKGFEGLQKISLKN